MVDHVYEQPQESVDEVLPASGITRQTSVQEFAIDVG
jgi:hypothetical protein